MGEQPPPGGGPPKSPTLPTLQTTTSDQTGGGPDNLPRRMRSFEEILADEKKNRNILVVKMTKIVKFVDGKEDRPPSLNIEDVSHHLHHLHRGSHNGPSRERRRLRRAAAAASAQ